jgi:type IV pilus assembly protein PilO
MNERRNLLLAGGAAFLVTVLFFVLLIRPKLAQIAEVRSEIVAAETEEARLRGEIARLEAIKKDAPATMARLARIKDYLPSTPELPSFIRAAQEAATAAGVDLISIAPSQPTALTGGTGIEQITVTLVLDGTYVRIQDFMSRLEQLSRIVQVTAFALSPQVDELSGRVSLNTTITMTMYVVQPDATLRSPSAGSTPAPSPTPTAAS